jgi:hypothetical protein
MTTRTIQAKNSGPVRIDATLASVDLTVYTEARPYGEITIATRDDTGPSADAVNDAELAAHGNTLTVRLDHAHGDGGTVIQTGNSRVVISGGSGVVVGNGVTMVNGRIVSGGGQYMQVGGSPITVVARVPHGSAVTASTQSGDIRCTGVYDQIDARSQSGDVEIGTAREVRAATQSGDVTVDALTGRGDLSSMSGDIEVRGPAQASATARTMSGDVRSAGGIAVAGSSMSGRIRNR